MGTDPRHDTFGGQGVSRYFERGVYIGERQTYLCAASVAGESISGFWPHVAYFCEECGEIWAREVVDTSAFTYTPRPQAKWAITTRACVEHGGGELLPPTQDLNFCSPPLLAREAQFYLLRTQT